jgi:cytoskeletal protein RodZ
MTGAYPTRRPPRRTIGHKGVPGSGRASRSTVGDRLRDAREAKGVDLFRVERDTKIRHKFLAALEDGDFADLPGDVYARGFLRNYASYLGLDADEVEEEWRREVGTSTPVREPAFVGPRPLTMRRGFTFQRSHFAIVGVVIIVAIVGVYFGYQVTRFLSYPTVGVTSPDAARMTLAAGTDEYTLTGTSTPGATIQISWDSQTAKTTIADEAGHWSYPAILHPGDNQFDITAENLDTNHASKTQQIIISVQVVSPPPPSPTVAFSSPADGATVKDGNVTVVGLSTTVAMVTVTPVYIGPPTGAGATTPPAVASPVASASQPAASASPGASAGPSASPGPSPASINTNADGSFSIPLVLAPGRWQLTMIGSNPSGTVSPAVVHTIVVPYKGINVVIQVKGDAAPVYASHDGIVDANAGVPDGWTITIVGSKYVCVNSARSNIVYITVNGTAYGAIQSLGGRRAYIDISGVPKNIAACPG